MIALQSTLNKQFYLYPLAKFHGAIFACVLPTVTAAKCVHLHSTLRKVYWDKSLPHSSLLQQHDGQQHKPELSKQTEPCQHARRVCFPPQRSRKVAQSAGIRKCGEKINVKTYCGMFTFLTRVDIKRKWKCLKIT